MDYNFKEMKVNIAIGSDHGGFELKEILMKFINAAGYRSVDLGTHSKDSCDYPLIGFEVADAVGKGKADLGVLICKTGVGMTVIANKVHGVRAAACYDAAMARSAREHNDTNVLVLGASYTDSAKAKEILKAWLGAKHTEERHARRVKQIKEIEKKIKGHKK